MTEPHVGLQIKDTGNLVSFRKQNEIILFVLHIFVTLKLYVKKLISNWKDKYYPLLIVATKRLAYNFYSSAWHIPGEKP